MKKSKLVSFGRIAILFFLVVLFFNAYTLFTEIRRDISYSSRSYGLNVLNEYFDEGNYYEIYEKTIENKYSDQALTVDASQYEAFGRWYHYYVMARTHDDSSKYLKQMEEAKQQITWKKLLHVIETLEPELD